LPRRVLCCEWTEKDEIIVGDGSNGVSSIEFGSEQRALARQFKHIPNFPDLLFNGTEDLKDTVAQQKRDGINFRVNQPHDSMPVRFRVCTTLLLVCVRTGLG
jgi:hypothetical protein